MNRIYISLGLSALNIIVPVTTGLEKGFNAFLITWCTIVIIFSLWFFFRFFYAAITGKDAIELTSVGIENNITRKTILWDEVQKLNILSGKASHILVIHLTTFDDGKPRNFIRSVIRNYSIKKYGSPIIIDTKVLNVTSSFLLYEMLIFKESYDILKG